jgi:hypothetical protein
MSTIIDIIDEDHEGQRLMLCLIARTERNSMGRRELFAKLSAEVRAHQEAEHRILHAALASEPRIKALLSSVRRRHLDVIMMLDALGKLSADDQTWQREFASFRRRLEDLLQLEERELLPFASRVLTRRTQRALGRDMRRREIELLSAA